MDKYEVAIPVLVPNALAEAEVVQEEVVTDVIALVESEHIPPGLLFVRS